MDILKWFIRAILAGICIAMGGVVFIQTTVACGTDMKWVGAILFAVGLFTVIYFGFNLYTGKVGYILQKDRTYLVQVLFAIIGNLVGCLIIGFFYQNDAANQAGVNMAISMCEAKLDLDAASALFKGVMCGLLMFIAVEVYRTSKSFLATFVCVPVFIMAGFEHSIADMFYFSAAMMWNLDSAIFIILILIGNLIGGCLIPAYQIYVNKEEPQ